ncbi:hypothetical protein V6N13_133823 [Hibiscus sabdariffa]|uniref:Uncharacterized protein n=1 Tax=Hibiscus sabdariffa TaxID=183260 RepID=A0ABR2R030_9ROSI
MESLKYLGESPNNPSDATSSPLAAIGLVGKPPDELVREVQSALTPISFEDKPNAANHQIRDENMLCEQREITKDLVEGIAIANHPQSSLE